MTHVSIHIYVCIKTFLRDTFIIQHRTRVICARRILILYRSMIDARHSIREIRIVDHDADAICDYPSRCSDEKAVERQTFTPHNEHGPSMFPYVYCNNIVFAYT
jgi:hypothetical protein